MWRNAAWRFIRVLLQDTLFGVCNLAALVVIASPGNVFGESLKISDLRISKGPDDSSQSWCERSGQVTR